MLVYIKENALQLHSRTVPAHMGYTSDQFKYRDWLRTIVGVWVEVERVQSNGNCIVKDSGGNSRYVDARYIETVKANEEEIFFRCSQCGEVSSAHEWNKSTRREFSECITEIHQVSSHNAMYTCPSCNYCGDKEDFVKVHLSENSKVEYINFRMDK